MWRYPDSYQKRRADTCWWLKWSSDWAQRDAEIWFGRSHTTGPWSPLDSGTGRSWWSEPGRCHRYDMWWGHRGRGHNAKDLCPHPPLQPDWLDTWSERADVETKKEEFDSINRVRESVHLHSCFLHRSTQNSGLRQGLALQASEWQPGRTPCRSSTVLNSVPWPSSGREWPFSLTSRIQPVR